MSTFQYPAPGEPDPLSAREKRILSDIETELVETAPELSHLCRVLGRASPSRPSLDRVLQIAAAVVIFLLIVPATWLPAVLVVAVMAGLPIAAGLAGRHAARDWRSDTDMDG